MFFFTSGFFAYYEDATVACDKIKVKIKHIFKLTVISECIYFLFSLVTNFFDNNIQEFFVSTFSIKNILSAVFLNIPIINGTLWFLYALLFSYIALYFVYKFNLFKICYFLSPIILILHVVIRPMLKSYEWYNAAYFRNFILYGFPLLIIGYWLRENKDKLGKIDNKKLILTIIIGTPCIFIEYLISMEVLDFYFVSLIVAIAIFIYAINNSDKIISPTIAYIGKYLSMHIYITHMICISLVAYLFKFIGIYENTIIIWITPFASLALTLIVSFFSSGEFKKKLKAKLD